MKTKIIDELFQKYQSLKLLPTVINASGAKWYYRMMVLLAITAYIIIVTWVFTGELQYVIYVLITSFACIVFHLISVNKSNDYVKRNANFSNFIPHIKFKWWAYSYESIISEYRYTKIKSQIGHNGWNTHIDDIINIIEADATKLNQFNWKPVVILGALLFPVISEYVGFKYNLHLQAMSTQLEGLSIDQIPVWMAETSIQGNKTLLELVFLMLLYAFLVWLLTFLSEKILLDKVTDKKNFIKLLRIIKIHIT